MSPTSAAELALLNARAVVEAEEEARRLHDPERDFWNLMWRVLVLSPTIEVCVALLRGEDVPTSRLDPEWLERLGWRP